MNSRSISSIEQALQEIENLMNKVADNAAGFIEGKQDAEDHLKDYKDYGCFGGFPIFPCIEGPHHQYQSTTLFAKEEASKFNANLIRDTGFIAAAAHRHRAPNDLLEIARRCEVVQIVALVNSIADISSPPPLPHEYDCLNYFSIEQCDVKDSYIIINNDEKKHYVINKMFKTNINLDGKNNEIPLAVFNVVDGGTILNINKPLSEQEKQEIWEICEKSKKGRVLVHCAAGLGRSGHLILMCEIIKNFFQIIASKNENAINLIIDSMIKKMRTGNIPDCRLGLVQKESQREWAIKGACQVIRYAFEKKYIEQDVLEMQWINIKGSSFASSSSSLFSPASSSRSSKIIKEDSLPRVQLNDSCFDSCRIL